MVRIFLDAELVVFFGNLRVVGQEVKSLTVTEVGRDTLRVQLAGVLEVLDSFLVLTQLTQESGVMEASPEVLLV